MHRGPAESREIKLEPTPAGFDVLREVCPKYGDHGLWSSREVGHPQYIVDTSRTLPEHFLQKWGMGPEMI